MEKQSENYLCWVAGEVDGR